MIIISENRIYEISFEPMTQSLVQKLSKEELKHFISLVEKVQISPKEVFNEIERFHGLHPDLPECFNLYTYALIKLKELKKAENLIEETYQKYPDYFFAKVNYADQCLRQKRWSKIPEIFPNLDLQALFPEKKVFHFSEFRGFMICMGYYHLGIKQKAKAEHYLQLAKKVEPDHISVKLLERKLFPPSIWNRFKNLFSKPNL